MIEAFIVLLILVVIFAALRPSSNLSKSSKKTSSKNKLIFSKSDIAWDRIPDEFVIFDLETTGLKTNKSPVDIVEISAIRIIKGQYKSSEKVDTFSALVKPWRGNLNPSAMAVNKITQEMIDAEGEEMPEVIRQFIDFVGDRLLVAYNVDFDRWFLQRELHDQGISKRFKYECALELSRTAFPNLKNHKLVTVSEHLGVGSAGAHRALQDCVMTMHAYMWAKTFAKKSTSFTSEDLAAQFGVSRNEELVGKNILFTGTLQKMSRPVAEELASIAGLTLKSAISKKVNFLVVGADPGAKLIRAKELNIRILDESEFLELIRSS